MALERVQGPYFIVQTLLEARRHNGHDLQDLFPAESDMVDNESDNAQSLDHGNNDDLFSSESEGEWKFSISDRGSSSSNSDEEEEEDSNTGEDITTDPYFIPQASLFDPSQPGNAFTSEQDFDFCQLPHIFNDHPSIRNAYICVFTATAFDGITHKAAASMLQGYSLVLESARHWILNVDNVPDDPFPGLDVFAQTLPTVEKRLGVSTEGFIMYLFQCPPTAPPPDGYDAFGDLNEPMKDVMDGWAWQTIQAGLERCRSGKWEIKDVDVCNVHQQFVALPNGLILQMSIDWYIGWTGVI
ncbi:hypothetical protein F5146DRAFT_1147323 [Armillaria mellea]|nr:hypothetical protein F5146DRAFT_1147323 [Armillaria mellea]